MVTAFGRGESLALALMDKGFDIQVYDLTDAFPFEYRRGAGPFPIPQQAYLGTHTQFFEESRALPRGLVLWLKHGPVEFAGAMAHFFVEHDEAFRMAVQNQPGADYKSDWMRRFLRNFVSAYHHEPWTEDAGVPFPVGKPLVLIPRAKELAVMGFDRLIGKPNYIRCQRLIDVQIESSRLTEMEIEVGKPIAVRAPQWIWCLSSSETEALSPAVADALFSRDIRRPEWQWLSMPGKCERGPWSDGFPKYSVSINDIHLPWVYSNMFVLEWRDKDAFEVWLKAPSETVRDVARRTTWAAEIDSYLNARMNLGRWKIDPASFGICPHSPVFPGVMQEWKEPGWRNWDWIAPETTARLDFGARFEREVQSFQRLMSWRNDQIKKQGARGDQALHAP